MLLLQGIVVARSALQAPREDQNQHDDDDHTQDADAAIAKAITVTAKSSAKAAEEKNDKYDEENGTERHLSLRFPWLVRVAAIDSARS